MSLFEKIVEKRNDELYGSDSDSDRFFERIDHLRKKYKNLSKTQQKIKIQEIEKLSLGKKVVLYNDLFLAKDPAGDRELLLGFFDRRFLKELRDYCLYNFKTYISDIKNTYLPNLSRHSQCRKSSKQEADNYEALMRKIISIRDFIFYIYNANEYIPYPSVFDVKYLKEYLNRDNFNLEQGKSSSMFIREMTHDIIDPEVYQFVREQYFLVNALLNDNQVEWAIQIISQHPEPEFLEMVFTFRQDLYSSGDDYSLEDMEEGTFQRLAEVGILTKDFFMTNILFSGNSRLIPYGIDYFYDQFGRADINTISSKILTFYPPMQEKIFNHLYFDETMIDSIPLRRKYLEKYPSYEEKRSLFAERNLPLEVLEGQKAFISLHDMKNPNTLLSRTFLNLTEENQLLLRGLEGSSR